MLKIKKYFTPTVLSYLGAIGVMATAVSMSKATLKAYKKIEEDADSFKESTIAEKTKVLAPIYAQPVILGATSMLCILSANNLSVKRQASLTSAYALLNQTYQQYRGAANVVYGPDADTKINAQMATDVWVSSDGYSLFSSETLDEDDKILFYDTFGNRYFEAHMAAVINAQYHINRNFALRGHATINELYDFIGLDHVDFGDEIGWDCEDLIENGITWVDFDNSLTVLDDGLECYIMTFMYGPAPLDKDLIY